LGPRKIGVEEEPGVEVMVKQQELEEDELSDNASKSSLSSLSDALDDDQAPKRLPRVILRLGPRPTDVP